LLSWDNLIKYRNVCLVYKIMHCLAPPPLFGLINFKSNTNRVTRAAARRDCIIPLKKTAFSQAVFSFAILTVRCEAPAE